MMPTKDHQVCICVLAVYYRFAIDNRQSTYPDNRLTTSLVESHAKPILSDCSLCRFKICFRVIRFGLHRIISWGRLHPSKRWSVVIIAIVPQDQLSKGESFWKQILLNCLIGGIFGNLIPFNSYDCLRTFLTFSWTLGSITDSYLRGSRIVQYSGHKTNITKWPCLYQGPQIYRTSRGPMYLFSFEKCLSLLHFLGTSPWSTSFWASLVVMSNFPRSFNNPSTHKWTSWEHCHLP